MYAPRKLMKRQALPSRIIDAGNRTNKRIEYTDPIKATINPANPTQARHLDIITR
jgi:hypothetical protein